MAKWETKAWRIETKPMRRPPPIIGTSQIG
jgi:hypothetical protein